MIIQKRSNLKQVTINTMLSSGARIGGKKTKRTKSSTNTTKITPIARPQHNQMYASVINILGGPHITVKCADGKERMAVIPGKFKGRSNWVQKNTIILLNLREYEDKKADVIYVYSAEDVKFLKKNEELTELLQFIGDGEDENEDVVFKGDNDDDDDEETKSNKVETKTSEKYLDDDVDLNDL